MSTMKQINDNPNPVSSLSQTRAILAYMRAGNTITPREARQMFRCDRLGARIKDIEKLVGYPPLRKLVAVSDYTADGKPTVKRVMSYWLECEQC